LVPTFYSLTEAGTGVKCFRKMFAAGGCGGFCFCWRLMVVVLLLAVDGGDVGLGGTGKPILVVNGGGNCWTIL
jgi:hypothetical protein